jgi:hypothetical protein
VGPNRQVRHAGNSGGVAHRPLHAGTSPLRFILRVSGDDAVDPDWAVEAMEHVTHYLQRLPPEAVTRMTADMQAIAAWAESHQMAPHFIDLARHFTEYAGLQPEE